MARNTLLGVAAANACANGIGTALNSGFARVYGGNVPATVDTALNQNTLLVEWQLANPAFGNAVAGQIAVNAVADATALATADATFFRLYTAAGTPMVQDTVGDTELGGEWGLVLTTRHIVQNTKVALLSLTYTQPT